MDVVAKYGSAPVPSPDLNQDFNGLIKIRIGGLAEEDRTDEFLERLAFQVARSAALADGMDAFVKEHSSLTEQALRAQKITFDGNRDTVFYFELLPG